MSVYIGSFVGYTTISNNSKYGIFWYIHCFFSVPFYRDFVDLAWWQSKFITRLSREKIFNGSEFFQTSSYVVEKEKIYCSKIFLTLSGWAEPGCGKCKLSGYFYTCRFFLLVQKVAFTRAMQNLSFYTCAKCGHVHIIYVPDTAFSTPYIPPNILSHG